MTTDNSQHKLVAINPATKEKIGEVICAADIPEIMRTARSSAEFLRVSGIQKIKEFLTALEEVLLQKEKKIIETIVIQTGKPIVEAPHEIFAVKNTIKFLLENIDALHRERTELIKTFIPDNVKCTIIPRPAGVVLLITPCDYSFGVSLTNALFALAAGCSIIIKPSPEIPLIGEIIKEILLEASQNANLSAPLIQIAQGNADCSKSIIEQRPDKVMFIGSTNSGRIVGAMCAERLIPHVLELGAKNPAIVFEDASLDYAVNGIRYGAFYSSGQVCASIGKVFIPIKFYDEFVAKLISEVAKLRQGDPLRYDIDLGPLSTKSRFENITHFMQEARVYSGARVIFGGKPNKTLAGFYYEPTIVEVQDLENPFWTEEIFGPIIPVMPYSDLEKVIEEINRSNYGLQASIWTKDAEKANDMAKRINVGTVFVNDVNYSYVIPELPWGGTKDSGYGISHSLFGLAEFIRPLNINITAGQSRFSSRWFPYGEKIK